MADLAYYLVGLIAALGGVVKLVHGRTQSRTPGHRYLIGVLLSLGLSAMVLAPATLEWGASWEPIPNGTRLVGNALTAGAVFSMVGLLAYAAHSVPAARRRMRVQTAVLVAALVAMTLLLTTAHTRFTVNFVDVYANRPVVAAYEVVFLCYATWGLVGIARLLHTVARHAERIYLRAGLRMIGLGVLFGLAWSAWKITISLLEVLDQRPVAIEGTVSTALSAAAILLVALGATMTAWGPHAAHPIIWLRARRALRQIEPLWSAVHAAVPEVEFRHPGAGLEFQLYHRNVEIRDSSLVLRVHFHPQVPAWTEDAARAKAITDDTELAVLVEAANLAAALEAHQAGHRYHADPSTAPAPRELDPDIDTETRWLIRVTNAFARSPVVEEIRQRVRTELRAAPISDRGSPTG